MFMYCFAGSDSSNIWKLVCFVLMKYNNKLNRSINLLFLPHYIKMIFYRSLILKKHEVYKWPKFISSIIHLLTWEKEEIFGVCSIWKNTIISQTQMSYFHIYCQFYYEIKIPLMILSSHVSVYSWCSWRLTTNIFGISKMNSFHPRSISDIS